ncbi:MAG: hypothetical protein ABJA98_14820, partial [Acidobacteriota bacterium]
TKYYGDWEIPDLCVRNFRLGGRRHGPWMRPEDLQWSTPSPAGLSDIRVGWDASGTITSYQADHYMPAMQDDRLVGAVLAGLPTPPPT